MTRPFWFKPRDWTPLAPGRSCCPSQPQDPHKESCTRRAFWGGSIIEQTAHHCVQCGGVAQCLWGPTREHVCVTCYDQRTTAHCDEIRKKFKVPSPAAPPPLGEPFTLYGDIPSIGPFCDGTRRFTFSQLARLSEVCLFHKNAPPVLYRFSLLRYGESKVVVGGLRVGSGRPASVHSLGPSGLLVGPNDVFLVETIRDSAFADTPYVLNLDIKLHGRYEAPERIPVSVAKPHYEVFDCVDIHTNPAIQALPVDQVFRVKHWGCSGLDARVCYHNPADPYVYSVKQWLGRDVLRYGAAWCEGHARAAGLIP